MKYDVIIIGSGLGGLECAHLLGQAGLHVLVLEQARALGGAMQSYRRQGLDYDTGFHCVGGLAEGGALHDAFGRLGLLKLPWHRLDERADRVLLGNHEYSLCQGFPQFVESLARDFPRQREGLEHYAHLLRQTECPGGLPRLLRREGQGVGREPSILSPQSSNLRQEPAYAWLRETLGDDLLVDVVSAPAMKLELRRDTLPLFSFLHVHAGYVAGSWRLCGGGSRIVDSLVSDIRAMGGDLLTGAPVVELRERDGAVTCAVTRDGKAYEADAFISDIHPALTFRLFKDTPSLRPVFLRRMDRLANTDGMFTLSLRLKPRTLRYFNWNQYVYPGTDVWAADDDSDTSATPRRPRGIMLSCRVPDDGGQWARQVDIMTPMPWREVQPWADTTVGRRGTAYLDMKARMARQCMDLAERFIPGLRGMAEGCSTSTPLTWRDYTAAPGGTAFGIRKDCRQPLMTFLSVRTPLSNLLLTGQSLVVHGVEGVTMTALATCEALLDELGVKS